MAAGVLSRHEPASSWLLKKDPGPESGPIQREPDINNNEPTRLRGRQLGREVLLSGKDSIVLLSGNDHIAPANKATWATRWPRFLTPGLVPERGIAIESAAG
jgi:hypothetical protein